MGVPQHNAALDKDTPVLWRIEGGSQPASPLLLLAHRPTRSTGLISQRLGLADIDQFSPCNDLQRMTLILFSHSQDSNRQSSSSCRGEADRILNFFTSVISMDVAVMLRFRAFI
jgi:hypothetical protein